jgi:hypothetical protein
MHPDTTRAGPPPGEPAHLVVQQTHEPAESLARLACGAGRFRPGRPGSGREACRAIVAEWIANGYAERVKAQDVKTGQWRTELHLYDVPLTGRRDTGSRTSPAPP